VARSCCTSIRTASLIGRGAPSRAISPAPDGRRGRDTGTCFDAADLALMPDQRLNRNRARLETSCKAI
jgi:hypothetical protein